MTKEGRKFMWMFVGACVVALFFLFMIPYAYQEGQKECPSGYTCEKINQPCWTYEYNTSFQIKNYQGTDKFRVIEGDSRTLPIGISLEQSLKKTKLAFENGTRIPRCDEVGE